MLPAWLPDTVTSELGRALHYTLLWGLEGVILRTVGGPGDRVPHVNEARVKRRLQEHDIAAVAVDPGLFEGSAEARGVWMNEVALLGETLAFCGRIGCRRVLVGALPGDTETAADALRRAGDAAARRGCVLAVRNEAGGRGSALAVAKLLDAAGHAAVRACWSPADGLEAGDDAEAALDALDDRAEVVIVRDGRPGTDGWQSEQVGEGTVGWDDVLRRLHTLGYAGPLCLDLSGGGGAQEGLSEATAMIRLARTARRASSEG